MISFIYTLMALTVTMAVGGAVAGYLAMTGTIPSTYRVWWLEHGVGGLLLVALFLAVILMNMGP